MNMEEKKLIFRIDKDLSQFYPKVYKIHDDVNQKYGVYPYSFHLEMVKNIAMENAWEYQDYCINNPKENCIKILLASVEHDLIEDTRYKYNDVFNLNIDIISSYIVGDKTDERITNLANDITEIVYTLTDEKGRSRGERHNEKYWNEIIDNNVALYIKLCDIYANMISSKYIIYNRKLYEMYDKEIHRLYNLIEGEKNKSEKLNFCYNKIFGI